MKEVLIIEDDQDCLEILDFLVKQMGYTTYTFRRAPSFSEVERINPDLIIADERLPGTKGSDLCKLFKKDKKLKSTPFILISAVSGLEEIAENCCADAFIIKPFDLDEVEEKALHYLN